jgi:hypothetical protein
MNWDHISEVPVEVRQTMSKTFVKWEKQDLGVETLVDSMFMDEVVTRYTCRAQRVYANRLRVPLLCIAVKSAHQSLSIRSVFKAVGLFVGICPRHIARLYYGRTSCSQSK